MNIEDLLGYKGKNVVITGVASGMAKDATELLLSLGANVYAIDRNEVTLPVTKAIQGDLSKADAIDNVVAQLPDKIDAAFLCHGVALIPERNKFVMMVNYVGQRHMAEALLPKIVDEGSITFISSTGGYKWEKHMDLIEELLACKTFEEQESWVEEHTSLFANSDFSDSYGFSKECLNAYVKSKCRSQEYIGRKIRINAIGPSFTSTALIKDFNVAVSKDGTEESGAQLMHDLFLKSWNGRPGKSVEMGYPLVIFGSKLCSYLSGQIIYIDFGMTGEKDYKAAVNNK